MARKDHDKYIGRWEETPCEPIDLPLSVDSFSHLLWSAARGDTTYSHQQIADWSHRLWWEVTEGGIEAQATAELHHAAEVAVVVDAQWDLFLVNTFTLAELQSMDFTTVRLPLDWFQNWLRQLEGHAA